MPIGNDKIDRPVTQNDQGLLDILRLCEITKTKPLAQILDDRPHELVVIDNKNAQRVEFRSTEHCFPG